MLLSMVACPRVAEPHRKSESRYLQALTNTKATCNYPGKTVISMDVVANSYDRRLGGASLQR